MTNTFLEGLIDMIIGQNDWQFITNNATQIQLCFGDVRV